MNQAYAGDPSLFEREYGGKPGRPWRYSTLMLITLAVIFLIAIVTCYFLLRTQVRTIFTDRNTLFNLDPLEDLNDIGTECCVRPGQSAPTRAYIYDLGTDITYSRDRPTNIDVVCANFPDVGQCVADNTDADGNIIPVATFESLPYFTFEKGLFVGCATTTTC